MVFVSCHHCRRLQGESDTEITLYHHMGNLHSSCFAAKKASLFDKVFPLTRSLVMRS